MAVPQMQMQTVLDGVKYLVAKQMDCQVEDILDDMTFDGLGMDSLDLVELIMDLEEYFYITTDDDDEEQLKVSTVKKCAEWIEGRGGKPFSLSDRDDEEDLD